MYQIYAPLLFFILLYFGNCIFSIHNFSQQLHKCCIFCVLPLSLLLTIITARWKLIRQISMLTHETQIIVNPKIKTNETITYLIIIKNGNSAQISDSKCSKLWKQTNECVFLDCSFMKARLLSPAGHFAFIVNIFPRDRKGLFLLGKEKI